MGLNLSLMKNDCGCRCVFESKAAWLEVLYDLGSMYQKKRNFVKGRKVFKRYIAAAPKDSVTKEMLSMVGLACTAMGDIAEGLLHYRSAIAMDADYKEAWLNLFQGLKECGKVRSSMLTTVAWPKFSLFLVRLSCAFQCISDMLLRHALVVAFN